MTEQDIKFYELLADKTLSFGCIVHLPWDVDDFRYIDEMYDGRHQLICPNGIIFDSGSSRLLVIGHEPTLTDLHRWLKERNQNERSFCHL